ncbi:hypothetical protein GCM10025331_67400 [Actinoplanes utahensis]|nr:hypothetical protein Aut01nite_53640 [Actinoplanes utahensis]
MHDALNHGRIDVESLRRQPAGLPSPRAADGRLVLAVDVSPWLRPDGDCSPQRSFCHTYGRYVKIGSGPAAGPLGPAIAPS